MSVRSALFAGAAFAAAVACQQRDRSFVPPPAQTAPTTPPPETEAAQSKPAPISGVDPAPGTAAPYGAGAICGVAIATQPPGSLVIEVSSAGPSTTRDRQGRAITVRRRTMTNPSPSASPRTPPELTTRPTDDPTDGTMRPDDTYDRNR